VPEPWEGRRGREESESEASRFVSFRMLEEVMDLLRWGNGCRLYGASVTARLGERLSSMRRGGMEAHQRRTLVFESWWVRGTT